MLARLLGLECGAAVFRPALFVVLSTQRAIFAVSHSLELSPRNPQTLKVVLDSGSTLVAKREVPLFGAAFIRVALDGHVQSMIGLQTATHALKLACVVRLQVGLVEFEVDAHRAALDHVGRDVDTLRSYAQLFVSAVDEQARGPLDWDVETD